MSFSFCFSVCLSQQAGSVPPPTGHWLENLFTTLGFIFVKVNLRFSRRWGQVSLSFTINQIAFRENAGNCRVMNCLNHYGFTKNWFYFPWTSLLFLFAHVPNRSWILTECRLSLSVILWRFFVVPAEVSPSWKISAKVLPFAGKGMFADHWVAVLHLLSILSFNTDNF